MKEIKILHLFPRLLSLYGDYGNVTVLKKTLERVGYTVSVTEYEDGEPDFDCDFIYIGAGVEKNVIIAKNKLLPYADKLKTALSGGVKMLATGSALAIFGKSLDGESALGVLDYTVKTGEKRYLSDVLTDENNVFSSNIVGYINSSYEYENANDIGNAIFGGQKSGLDVGVMKGGFIGVQLTGPFLVKNVHALEYYAKLLTGENIKIPEDANQKRAYDVAVKELKLRMEGK